MIRIGAFILTVLALSGCAAPDSGRDSAPADEPVGIQACFYSREVTGFRYLDRSNLIVYAPGRSRAYRVTITPPSFELRSAETIAFTSRSNRVCGYAGDALLIGRGTGRRYSISAVRRLDEAALDALLADDEAELEPKPAEGAEIERDAGSDAEAGDDN